MSKAEERLKELGLVLPEAPDPMANYVGVRRDGDVLYFSGAGPFQDKKPVVFGRIGAELTLEEGYEAAKLTGLNLLSLAKKYAGDLDKVQILKVTAFVASAPEFYRQPDVVNGLSDVFAEVLGDKGCHARTAVAVPQLPFNTPVEAEMIVRVEE